MSQENKTSQPPNIIIATLQEKALRVTEALYRTTDLFLDHEPLKWSLRSTAVDILNSISRVSVDLSYESLRDINRTKQLIDGIFFKINLAASGTFITRKNFEVLERAYIDLKSCLDAPRLSDSFLDQKSLHFFIGDINPPKEPPEQKQDEKIQKPITLVPERVHFESEPHDDKKATKINSILRDDQGQSDTIDVSERKAKILGVVREHGTVSIGDISRFLNLSVSEKTIQRDLNTMVDTGILQKEGEKRWRRYFVHS